MDTKLRFIIEADAMTGVAEVRRFSGELDKTGHAADRGATQGIAAFERFGQTLSRFAVVAATAAGAALIGLGVKAGQMAVDAVESENLFEVSMGKMAAAARAWSQELNKTLGLNQYEVRKTVGTFNVMLTAMGVNEQAAFDMSKGLTKLAYDMASFYNLRPEEAFLKLESGITGEIEPLKRLGIVVREESVQLFAYAHGIARVGEDLTEIQKIMARYGLIMQQTAAAQGDLARTIESPANRIRVLRGQVEELAVKFGEQLLPMLAKVTGALSDFVKGIDTSFGGMQRMMDRTVALGASLVAFIAVLKGASIITTVSASLAAGGTAATAFGAAAAAAAPFVAAFFAAFAVYKIVDAYRNIGALIERYADFRIVAADSAAEAKKYMDGLAKMGIHLDTAGQSLGQFVDNLGATKLALEGTRLSFEAFAGPFKKIYDIGAAPPPKGLDPDAWKAVNHEMRMMLSQSDDWRKIVGAAADAWEEARARIQDITQLEPELVHIGRAIFPAMEEGFEDASRSLDEWEWRVRSAYQRLMDDLENIRPRTEIRPDIKTPTEAAKEALEPKIVGEMTRPAKTIRDEWARQVSTIVTDWSRGIADMITSGKSFGDQLKNIFRETANSIIRIILEAVFRPFQKWLVETIGGIFKPGGGTATAGGTLSTVTGLSFGAISGAGGGGGAHLQDIAAGGGAFLGISGKAGQVLQAAAVTGGLMAMTDAFKRGGTAGMLEGAAGGAAAGAAIGSVIPGIGTAIGAAVGAMAGFVTGLFGGGEKRRQEEQRRREALQAQYTFASPTAVARTGVFGSSEEYDVESGLTGRVRAIRRQPAPTVVVNVQAWDVADFERRTGQIGQLVSRALLRGGSQLADNIGYTAAT